MMQHVLNYNERNIDELIILDINASKEGREPNFEALKEFTSELYCPVTYGGGISKLSHIEQALKAGADKVSMKSYLGDFKLRTEAVKKFGSQCIVASVDYYYGMLGIIDYCKMLEEDGIGEILFNSTELNGTRYGYDISLLNKITNEIKIPVIANCGCGEPAHMLHAIEWGAHAVAASSMFMFTEYTPRDCAKFLAEHGVPTRVENNVISDPQKEGA
jgi:cyclase